MLFPTPRQTPAHRNRIAKIKVFSFLIGSPVLK